jgi:hypothetical protein
MEEFFCREVEESRRRRQDGKTASRGDARVARG